MSNQVEKGATFARMHNKESGIIILPNAWDVGSAIMMAEAGFPAIATTSSGIAFAQGFPDGGYLGRDRMFRSVAAITAAVAIPVTADLEFGYGLSPEDVSLTVFGALTAGAVGGNIEDSVGDKLLDIDLASDRIRAGAEAARSSKIPFVLNARVDAYLFDLGSPAKTFSETVKRANTYRAAGADCLFVLGPMDEEAIASLVREIDAPLNVLGARGGVTGTLSIPELERLGVKRVTLGGSLATASFGLIKSALKELRECGTYSYTSAALSHSEVNELMKKFRASVSRNNFA